MLVEFVVLIEGSSWLAWSASVTSHGSSGLRRGDKIDTDAKTWLSRIDLHLRMLLMLLPLRFDLVNSLLQ